MKQIIGLGAYVILSVGPLKKSMAIFSALNRIYFLAIKNGGPWYFAIFKSKALAACFWASGFEKITGKGYNGHLKFTHPIGQQNFPVGLSTISRNIFFIFHHSTSKAPSI